jgi:hypothetical protein
MPIPSEAWDSRHEAESAYDNAFRSRYRSLGDAIYDEYDNLSEYDISEDFSSRDTLQGLATAGEGYAAWITNNLLGSAAPGDSFDNPYSFNFGEADKESFLKSLGCRADRESMCRAYTNNRNKTTAGVKHTLFGLALCDSGVRDQLGNEYEPFEWTSGGQLKLYDRYNFTDLGDFSRAAGGNIFEAAAKAFLIGVFARGPGGLIGILNNSGITDAVNSFFNVTSRSPDFDSNPFFDWRSDGDTIPVTSITRTNRTVTVVTSSPHNFSAEDGGGIKIVEGDGSATTGNTFNIVDTGGNQAGNNRPNGVDITVVDANTFRYYDPYDRPDFSSDGTGLSAVRKKRWGRGKNMYTVDTFSATDLRNYNPELYYDAVARGYIPYSAVPGQIPVGAAQPNPFVAGIGGLTPQPPVNRTITPSNSSTYGFGDYGTNPAPFNSWSQGINNATYDLGPYAKLNKFVIPLGGGSVSICEDIEDWKDGGTDAFPLWGRIIVIPSGVGAGDLGFVLQDWYNFDDSPYNTDNGDVTGTPFQSKAEWWDSTIKSNINVRFTHLSTRPIVNVEIAYSNPGFDEPTYYKGPDISGVAPESYELLVAFTALAAITRWL